MFLGIDLGTSEIKVLLLSGNGQIVATAASPLDIQRPKPLWSEQQPADWWAGLVAACAQLSTRAPHAMQQVQAIGLTGQMHGAVLLNAAGEVLRPAILWNDGRSSAECQALEAQAPRLRTITGNIAMPGFTAPKLLWLRTHEPDVFKRCASVLLPKDWLRWQLTGERYSDMSDASGTLWLDVAARDWSEELLAACGMARAQMPQLVEGNVVAGRLHAEAAALLGLPAGIAVAGGGGDNAASAVGIGAVSAGQGFVSLGTSGVIFVVSERFIPNTETAVHAFCHALPQRWHQMSVMLSAASALRWAAQTTGATSEAAFVAEAEALSSTERIDAPIFLPYLSGERTPHNDPAARASWLGLSHTHGRGHLAHAVIEGVNFGLLDGWHALSAEVRSAVPALTLVGGGARSRYWAQWLASTLGVPLQLRDGGATAAALGATRLAALALGGDQKAVCSSAPVTATFEPNPDLHTQLQERYDRFRAAYLAMRVAS